MVEYRCLSPKGFHIFWKDRADGYGGVLLVCQEVVFDTNAEAIVSKITVEHYGTLKGGEHGHFQHVFFGINN